METVRSKFRLVAIVFGMGVSCLVAASEPDPALIEALRDRARPLGEAADLDPLMERATDRRLVLLGEASHGTREFYTWRTEITRRLIEEQGFSFVAVEGDWKSLYRLNRYVKGYADGPATAGEALEKLDRWPQWMWGNLEVVELAEWMRAWNAERPFEERVGFYGKDVYGVWDSLDAVLAYYRENHPEEAQEILRLYSGFARFHGDGNAYARAVMQYHPSAAGAVSRVFERAVDRHRESPEDPELYFLKQNARVVKYAERHFRSMGRGGADSWNYRVDHMTETVESLLNRYSRNGNGRGIVWAHNTHIGDARATDMAQMGQHNIGQLARERLGRDAVYSIGFSTYEGTVFAGYRWGGQREIMTIPPARPDSYDAALQALGMGDVLVVLDPEARRDPALRQVRGLRAIGVIYNPRMDPRQNFVPTILPERFDALLFISQTEHLTPLE